jgi:hypothetical protein
VFRARRSTAFRARGSMAVLVLVRQPRTRREDGVSCRRSALAASPGEVFRLAASCPAPVRFSALAEHGETTRDDGVTSGRSVLRGRGLAGQRRASGMTVLFRPGPCFAAADSPG